MNAVALLVTAAVLGVDYGWQPTADGQLEYIIQIEPVTLIALRGGQDLVSQLDPYVRRVRRFRVRVGTELVPRRGTPPGEPELATAAPPPPGVQYGWQPIDNQQLEFIIQVEPERLAAMRNGEDISGEIPAVVQNVARVRLRAGSGPLPQQGLQTASAALPAQPWAAGGQARQVAAEVPDTEADPERPPEPAPELGPPASSPPDADRPQRPEQPQPPAAGDSRAAASAPSPDPAEAGRLSPGLQREADPASSDRPPASNSPRLDESTGAADPELEQPNSAPGQRPGGSPAFDNGSSGPGSAAASPAPPSRYDPPAARAQADSPAPASSGWGPQSTAATDAPRATPGLPAAPPGPQTGQGPGGWAPTPPAAAAAEGSWSTEPLYATAPQPDLSSPRHPAAAAPAYGQGSPYPTHPGPPAQPGPPGGGSAQPPPSEPIPPAAPGYPGSPYPGDSPAGQPAPPAAWPGQYGQTADPRWPAGDAAVPVSQVPYRGGYPLPGLTGNQPLLPWEERLEGIERDRRAVELAENFWSELARTAGDPGLAFLREDSADGTGNRPWGALTLTLLVMFASLGANLYMGWIAVDMYRRYLALADDLYDEEPRGRARSEDDLLDELDDLDDLDDPAPLRRRRRRATLAA